MMVSGSQVFSRFTIESIEPALYLALSYYGRWMFAREHLLVVRDPLSTEEMDARMEFYRKNVAAEIPRRHNHEVYGKAVKEMCIQRSPQLDVDMVPRFSTGDEVRSHNGNHSNHTRLPRYALGRVRSRPPVSPWGLQLSGHCSGRYRNLTTGSLQRSLRDPGAMG